MGSTSELFFFFLRFLTNRSREPFWVHTRSSYTMYTRAQVLDVALFDVALWQRLSKDGTTRNHSSLLFIKPKGQMDACYC